MDTWFDRVWNQNDADYIDEGCDIDVTTIGHIDLGKKLNGPAEFKAFHAVFCALVTDIEMRIVKSMEDGDWFSAVYTVTGKSIETGVPFETTGSTYLRMKNGKIAEVHEHFNFLDCFQKIGLLPDDTLEQCLSGRALQI